MFLKFEFKKNRTTTQYQAIFSGFEPPTTREFNTWLNESSFMSTFHPIFFLISVLESKQIQTSSKSDQTKISGEKENSRQTKNRINISGHFTQPQNQKKKKINRKN
jgi:hypothetical protein